MNRAFRMTCAAAFISLFLVLAAASAAAAGAAPQSDIESTGLNLANNDSGPTSSLLTETELEELLVTLEKELGSIQTIRTDFVQEKHLSIFINPVMARGRLFFLKPDNVRFEITEPFHSVLIAQSKSVAKYEFVENEWKKLNIGIPDALLMVTGQIATWLQGRFRDKSDIYKISATTDEPPIIILTPRSEKFKKFITAIELELTEEKDRIASVTIRESGDDFTRMTFSNQESDVALPISLFDTAGDAPADPGQLLLRLENAH